MGVRSKGEAMSRDSKQQKTSDVKWYSPFDVVIIGIDTDDGPQHNLCDPISNNTPLVEWKIVHAMEHGIEDPCIAIRDGDKILIWKGRSRTRYAREACNRLGKRDAVLLPLIIKRGAHDADGVLGGRILENWLRRDLNIVDKAKEANQLIERKVMTEEEVCERLGIGLPRLKEMLKLLNLSGPVQDAIRRGPDNGGISASSAAPLVKFTVEIQNEKLAEILKSGAKPTINRVREATGKAEVQTPKVRLAKAADALQAIAGDLAMMISDNNPMMASLSVLAHAVTGKTWQELTTPVTECEAEAMTS
jgi:ParB-like chromosome segregation protein Spo0J